MNPIGRPHQPDGAPAPPPPPPPAPPAEEPAVAAVEEERDGVGAQPDPGGGDTAGGDAPGPTMEDLVEELEAVINQRDEYLELARHKQAEFENFRKQAAKRQLDHAEQAAASLVTELLPVLDALDNGVSHGDESLAPVRSQLLGVLEKEGLVRVDPVEDVFDPNDHDAVAHEPGDGGEPVVAETLRAGYRWRGRLVRPAMVRVRG
ncbi:MAG: nucleotide exchange factor GrpE [Actinobacteria bacterium]|nr:nucleotide exchange factor GrpE [Actinomycetota bacterium]